MPPNAVTDERPIDAPRDNRSTAKGILRLVELRKSFGDVHAVDGVDLTLEPGEFLTLLGPSGSGKTTTLLMIAGFERPTGGEIYLDDKRITTTPAHHRDMGMVFQNYALFPHMTVFDNVAFPLRMRSKGRDEVRKRVRESLALVHLEGYEGRYPRELSGGQQQRVALARASVYAPPLMLMDEPLSALDRKLRGDMQVEIRRLHRDLGTTMVSVTHDQEEALALSDRIALMNDGKIEQIGSAREIYERPQTLFAARFLGDSNCLGGEVTRQPDNGIVEVALPSGAIVRGRSDWKPAKGESVVVMTRPERGALAAAASGDTEAGANEIEFNLEEAVYLGDRLRCHGTFATGDPAILMVDVREGQDLLGSGRAWVSWKVDDTVVLRQPNNRAAA